MVKFVAGGPVVRARLWVPNQFTNGPGAPDRCPAILVGANLLLMRHARFPKALAEIPGYETTDLFGPNEPTWTAEPLGKRPWMPRDISTSRYDFDRWPPVAAYLRFRPKTRKATQIHCRARPFPVAAGWSLSLRSAIGLPWAVLYAGGGELGIFLESVRELVKSEGHTLPPIMVDPKTPNICPADDLPHVPQREALGAVEGLLARMLNRP